MLERPEVFGMHDNAEISAAINESQKQCDVILGLLPRTGGGSGGSLEEVIKAKCAEMLEKLPKAFDVFEVGKKYPIRYEECMNTVLQQELIRYNRMIVKILSTLDGLRKAMDGLVSMSDELDDVFNSMVDNKVPASWTKVAYPSLKPLGSWTLDFIARLKMFQDWIDQGAPASFWVSGFYFTHSFFTGVKQNFARKYQIPIDTLTFDNQPIPASGGLDIEVAPENGCYLYGLYIECAKWNEETQLLDESDAKVLYTKMCYMYLIPMTVDDFEANTQRRYSCPVYRTSARRGVLTTTGHSSNFVCNLELPISDEHTPEHWTKRGVACLSQLDD